MIYSILYRGNIAILQINKYKALPSIKTAQNLKPPNAQIQKLILKKIKIQTAFRAVMYI
ncbi:hypothetical protein [Flavobacterium sp.]|uniref:hypothetical protein n=1 Tax=Flavobacterium sp. TaxID=239 RepID=UPI0026054492|nr:hypothetical protein [Flavobacterium sp.]